MAGSRVFSDLYASKAAGGHIILDPGNGQAIRQNVDSAVVLARIAASTAEYRLLPNPTNVGVDTTLTIIAETVGSNGTLAFKDYAGNVLTSLPTLSAAGDRAELFIDQASGTKVWASEIATPGTVQAGAALVASTSLDLLGFRNLSATGYVRGPGQTIAAAGSSQSNAATLVEGMNYVTGANGTKGVKLPAATITAGVGQTVVVVNAVASNLLVWPSSGDSIESQGTDSSQTVAASKRAIFVNPGGDGVGGAGAWFELLGA
jgi:hypothetical protein